MLTKFSAPICSELVTQGAVWNGWSLQRKLIRRSSNACKGGLKSGWTQSSSLCLAKIETSTDCSVRYLFLKQHLYVCPVTDDSQHF